LVALWVTGDATVASRSLDKPPFDAEAWFARLDELGGREFLPDGIPDDPPVQPDPRVFFDE
jgi:antitoxin VapB